jgi:hypothetical protein
MGYGAMAGIQFLMILGGTSASEEVLEKHFGRFGVSLILGITSSLGLGLGYGLGIWLRSMGVSLG